MLLPIILDAFFINAIGIMPCVLRAGGDSMFCSLSSLIIMWVVRVFAGYILTVPIGMGIMGLWVTMPFEWFIRTIIYWRRFRHIGLRQ
jgi:Na+-driven multidrug efflux pump